MSSRDRMPASLSRMTSGGGGVTSAGRSALTFFDESKVKKQMAAADRRALSRAGGLLRKHVRSYQLRRRKGVSEPGKPPNIHHQGKGGLRNVLYGWDERSRSVVIGPVFYGQTMGVAVPQLLEHGGNFPASKNRRGQKRSPLYQARPYMSVAYNDLMEKGLISKQYAGELRGG